jgi:hypothetical protein
MYLTLATLRPHRSLAQGGYWARQPLVDQWGNVISHSPSRSFSPVFHLQNNFWTKSPEKGPSGVRRAAPLARLRDGIGRMLMTYNLSDSVLQTSLP